MLACSEGQTPNNERETKTILNCFLPNCISYLSVHLEKRHACSRCGGLSFDATVASRKRRKRQLTEINRAIAGEKVDCSDEFVAVI